MEELPIANLPNPKVDGLSAHHRAEACAEIDALAVKIIDLKRDIEKEIQSGVDLV